MGYRGYLWHTFSYNGDTVVIFGIPWLYLGYRCYILGYCSHIWADYNYILEYHSYNDAMLWRLFSELDLNSMGITRLLIDGENISPFYKLWNLWLIRVWYAGCHYEPWYKLPSFFLPSNWIKKLLTLKIIMQWIVRFSFLI